MTIDELGRVGIGTRNPTQAIHIAHTGATGVGSSLFIDGETGVDGIIFPDRTIQTTAASGIAGTTGATGPQGIQGPAGAVGASFTGATGPQGPAGADGADAPVGSTGDHGFLQGLTDDDHTQYALLAGRLGGQTLIGGTGPGDDLTLLSTSETGVGSIFIATQSDAEHVIIGTNPVGPTHKLSITTSTNSIASSAIDDSELGVVINHPENATGSGVGIGFSISSGASIGSAIVHRRTGSGSIGELHFATRSTASINIPMRMTIGEDGNVGIGVTGPTHALHIRETEQGSGSVFIDGQTGVDGIIFPDRTIQTTAGAITDHGNLAGITGVSNDDHDQYAFLTGRSGGQILIGGTDAGDDLTLQSTSDGSKGNVFLGDAIDTNFIQARSIGNAITGGTTVDTSNLGFRIHRYNNDTSTATGFGFGISTGFTLVGAAIIHERTWSSSIGKLHFATKVDTNIDIPIHMTVDDTGWVGIGTQNPTSVLHLSGSTGVSLYIDGATGVDGIIFPDLTVQTTSAAIQTKVVYIEPPALADEYPITIITQNIRFTKVWAQTDANTVDFNIEFRALTTPFTDGTEILSSDLQATSSGVSTTTFVSSGDVIAGLVSPVWIWYDATAISGTAPAKVIVGFEYIVVEK
jgi:hypothetical protein